MVNSRPPRAYFTVPFTMAQYWVPQVGASFPPPLEHSSIHQQRRYLLERLANQEAHGEHLANMREVTKIKLSVAQEASDRTNSLKLLKEVIEEPRVQVDDVSEEHNRPLQKAWLCLMLEGT